MHKMNRTITEQNKTSKLLVNCRLSLNNNQGVLYTCFFESLA